MDKQAEKEIREAVTALLANPRLADEAVESITDVIESWRRRARRIEEARREYERKLRAEASAGLFPWTHRTMTDSDCTHVRAADESLVCRLIGRRHVEFARIIVEAVNEHNREPSDQHVWVVEKLWTDSMENHPANAIGYEAEGYVDTAEEADRLIEDAGPYLGDCWAARHRHMHRRRKVKLPRITNIVKP